MFLKKYGAKVAGVASAVGAYAVLASSAFAQTDPLGVASSSEQLTGTAKTYIGIAVTNYWPVLLGGLVLGAIIGAVIYAFSHFTRR